ncbi:hypothetical protein Hanom_Chr04g00348961 [Helianthus anomalus]
MEQSKEYLDDFDTESILNDEIEQGIDSIMGDCTAISENHGTNDTVTSPATIAKCERSLAGKKKKKTMQLRKLVLKLDYDDGVAGGR